MILNNDINLQKYHCSLIVVSLNSLLENCTTHIGNIEQILHRRGGGRRHQPYQYQGLIECKVEPRERAKYYETNEHMSSTADAIKSVSLPKLAYRGMLIKARCNLRSGNLISFFLTGHCLTLLCNNIATYEFRLSGILQR